jgi:hypothetical protein
MKIELACGTYADRHVEQSKLYQQWAEVSPASTAKSHRNRKEIMKICKLFLVSVFFRHARTGKGTDSKKGEKSSLADSKPAGQTRKEKVAQCEPK